MSLSVQRQCHPLKDCSSFHRRNQTARIGNRHFKVPTTLRDSDSDTQLLQLVAA
ncbi:MAG: hypothetical protein QGF53_08460 [Alphaproteobacteria bacterium]|nr:hypothetical protein [Alphaproteobacteria bacterium]